DRNVTGVQTCALPIYPLRAERARRACDGRALRAHILCLIIRGVRSKTRSENGTECETFTTRDTGARHEAAPAESGSLSVHPQVRSEERRVGKGGRIGV